jgi:DNA-directed RNA polymerase subunit K/omega
MSEIEIDLDDEEFDEDEIKEINAQLTAKVAEDEEEEEEEESDEEEEEEDDKEEFAGNDITKYINPETLKNNDWVREKIIVPPEERVTSHIMQSFEEVEVLARRAKQIAEGSPIYTDYEGLTEAAHIAKKELLDKKCPLSVMRQIKTNPPIFECWEVNEMTLIHEFS